MRDEPAPDIGRPPEGCVLAIVVVCACWVAVLLWVWPW